MHIVTLVLMLIRATKENDLDLHVATLYELCPLFFTLDHNNYARYIPVYLLTLMNLDETQPGAKQLLAQNGFSVSRSASQDQGMQLIAISSRQLTVMPKHRDLVFSRNYAAYFR